MPRAKLKADGASDEDIAIALGQKTTAMARHYSEGASKRRRMGAVVELFDPLKKSRSADAGGGESGT